MTANPFCGRFNYDVCPIPDGTGQVSRCSKGVVNKQRQIVFFGYSRYLFPVGNIEIRISKILNVNGFRVIIDQFLNFSSCIIFSEPGFDAKAFEGYFKLVVCSTIQIR